MSRPVANYIRSFARESRGKEMRARAIKAPPFNTVAWWCWEKERTFYVWAFCTSLGFSPPGEYPRVRTKAQFLRLSVFASFSFFLPWAKATLLPLVHLIFLHFSYIDFLSLPFYLALAQFLSHLRAFELLCTSDNNVEGDRCELFLL